MGEDVMLGAGVLMLLVGSSLADSESFIPCLVFSLIGMAIIAYELHIKKMKGEKK